MIKCPKCGYEFEPEEKIEAIEEKETTEDISEKAEQVSENDEISAEA